MSVPSLADAKEWLGVDFTDDDALITSLISACTKTVSDYTGTVIGDAQDSRRVGIQYRGRNFAFRLRSLHEFDNADTLKLHAWNTDGKPFSVSAGTDYGLVVDGWRVTLTVLDAAWDALDAAGTVDTALPVEITLACGIPADMIPDDWRQAILVLVTEQYNNRGSKMVDRKTVSQVLLNRILPRL